MPSKDAMDRLEEDIRQEVQRLEARLLEIVGERVVRGPVAADSQSAEQPALPLVDVARRLADARRIRRKYFSPELFHERAWDMLLELFVAHTSSRDVWVKSLLSAADGSPTTAIRWLDHLESIGLIVRRADESDRRRVIVNLSAKSEAAMLAFLQDARSLI